jgi:hypothetical protein
VTISISGQVPAAAQNGMAVLEEHWTQERTPEPVYAVVKIERDGLKFKDSDQLWSATMKFTHIEPLEEPADVAAARELLEKACGARGGETAAAQSVELDIPEAEEPKLDLEQPLAEKSGEGFEGKGTGNLKAVK